MTTMPYKYMVWIEVWNQTLIIIEYNEQVRKLFYVFTHACMEDERRACTINQAMACTSHIKRTFNRY